MTDSILRVASLVRLLQDLVEENFVQVLVQGELSNVSRPASGHCYFTLKDSHAQIRCAMFRPHARLLRFALAEGQEVICRGRVSVYPQRGDLQFIVEGLEPVGVGGLQLAFEQLRDQLAAEGLLAAGRKRPLPAHPQVIGIVTSASGAAIHDILTVLRRRSAGVRVLLRPVRVQGEEAAGEIAAGIADLCRDGRADVLIVGRGGGSREDLWAFNEEVVARAIAASRIPVISAVGHEVDVSISDLVADLRAATPSAAAELVVQNRLELERHLDQLQLRLAQQFRGRLELLRSRLAGLSGRLRPPAHDLKLARLQLQQLQARLQDSLQRQLRQQQQLLEQLAGRLDDLSPLGVLGRGYAIVRAADSGAVLKDAAQVKGGDCLQITLAHGELRARVTEVRAAKGKTPAE